MAIEADEEELEINGFDEGLERAFREGLLEKLIELSSDDIFYTYGVLIAQDKIEFNDELINDPIKLFKRIPNIKAINGRHKRLDW